MICSHSHLGFGVQATVFGVIPGCMFKRHCEECAAKCREKARERAREAVIEAASRPYVMNSKGELV